MMTRTCLCLIRRTTADGPEVLLGLKKTGFGQGRWVGLGGHIEDGEKPAEAAAREVAEESSLVVSPDALEHMANIEFRFPSRPSWDQTADVFMTTCYQGEAGRVRRGRAALVPAGRAAAGRHVGRRPVLAAAGAGGRARGGDGHLRRRLRHGGAIDGPALTSAARLSWTCHPTWPGRLSDPSDNILMSSYPAGRGRL